MHAQVPAEARTGHSSSPNKSGTLDNYKLAEELVLQHMNHVSVAKPDIDCHWCIYCAYLDKDLAFLKKAAEVKIQEILSFVKSVEERRGVAIAPTEGGAK
jgi:hypothetical protein